MSLTEKYDTEKKWTEPCHGCGKPVEMCAATWEVLGVYHTGCFGYPACSCPTQHEGECPPEPQKE